MASYLANFKQIFTRFDANGDGKLSPSELQCLLRSISQELSLEEAETVVECSDSDGDGLLDINEFAKFVGDKSETKEDERELKEAYEMFVMKEEGHITAKSLKRLLSRLGTPRAIEKCMGMICRFDGNYNGDGVLNFDEFKTMMI